ncbi:MAG: class I fructose-bisphosphate aldolase [Verrucomicrobiota bacterium]
MTATNAMEMTARTLVAAGRGILAADESLPTIEKRFSHIGLVSTESNRRLYRELLFTTPRLGECISGVILFDETLRQSSADGTPFVEVLKRQGILPGIKVDRGAKPLAGFPDEKITEGLDGLRDRLQAYSQCGAVFTKWRAVIRIAPGIPTATGLKSNAHALARFAALSQESGLVPIVEPEVLMDGAHSIEQHFATTEAALQAVFEALFEHRVKLEAMLLKPNMVLSGATSPNQVSINEAAEQTLCCLLRTVPAAVPGIVFLSGGQTPMRATQHLNALNRLAKTPWELSFSFGRALQEPVLETWRGNPDALGRAQEALTHRARCNRLARFGRYSESAESETRSISLA